MNEPPIFCRWEGDSFTPMDWSRKACDRLFVVGEVYPLVVHQPRSAASHSHFFARLHDLWLNLPERYAVQYPTSEHLRKAALILTGHRDERSIVAASKAEAQRFAAFLKPIDEYAIISVHDCVVVEWKAKSQSVKAMGNADFQRSKSDVLAFIEEMIGLEPGAAVTHAGQSA